MPSPTVTSKTAAILTETPGIEVGPCEKRECSSSRAAI
jgi:hypothetical protein